MKWPRGIVFWSFHFFSASAQVFHSAAKSAYLTGGAYSAHFTDAFSFTVNPAVLGGEKTVRVAISNERRWMLRELAYFQMACSFSAGRGGMGLQFHYTGNSDYNETALAMSYGKDLGRIAIGVQFRYDFYHVAGYGNMKDASAMPGLQFHLSEKTYAGIAFNISFFQKAGNHSAEKASGIYRMGIGYEASPYVFLSMQFEKEAGIPTNIIGCVDYRWNDQFFAAAGLASNSASPYIKAGWKKNNLVICIFTAYQATLGFTPGLVLLWEGKNKSG